jgi:hypothetical protein
MAATRKGDKRAEASGREAAAKRRQRGPAKPPRNRKEMPHNSPESGKAENSDATGKDAKGAGNSELDGVAVQKGPTDTGFVLEPCRFDMKIVSAVPERFDAAGCSVRGGGGSGPFRSGSDGFRMHAMQIGCQHAF